MNDLTQFIGGNFDYTQYNEYDGNIGDFEPLAPGWYQVMIEKAEVKPTKAGNGHYLWLQFSVIGGEGAGRKAFTTITLQNPSEKAVRIGKSKLATMANAAGVPAHALKDTSALIDKVLWIKLTVVYNDHRGKDDNVVKGFRQTPPEGASPRPIMNSQRPTMPMPTAQPERQPQAQQPTGRHPWARQATPGADTEDLPF